MSKWIGVSKDELSPGQQKEVDQKINGAGSAIGQLAAQAAASAASAESSAALSAASNNPFPTTADGVLNTSGSGATYLYFSVPGTGGAPSLLYRNDAGTAVLIGSALSGSVDSLTINAGKPFPLKSATRYNGTAPIVSAELVVASKAILDIKVVGNPAGKFIRFAYYSNGTTAFGGGPDYGMIFESADIATYASTGAATQVITRTNTTWTETVVSGTVITRTYRTTTVDGLLVTITYDKAVFDQTLGTPVVLNGSTLPGYSWIIDPACYLPMQAARVLDSLKVNTAVDFPLASYSRFNGTAPVVSAAESRLNRAILDIKITGVDDGKLVHLAYLANGTTAFGGGPNYGMIFEIADAATYNTTGVATSLIARIDPWQEVPGEGTIVTRYYRQTSQAQGGMTVAITYDKAVLAEIDGTPIVMNNPSFPAYSWIIDPACYRPAEKPVAQKPRGFVYSATADVTTFVWQYSPTALMRMKIGRQGPNLLNDIGEIAIQDATTLTLGGTWTVITVGDITDWLGPYQVTAVNNGDGGGSVQSTGGHHPINSTTTPTAEQISREFYADGGLVTTGSGYADELHIAWSNQIMGWNTMTTARRYILREDYVLRIRPGSLEPMNTITALEDIVIGNYFGLQMYDPGHDQSIHFFNGQDGGRVAVTPTVAQYSGNSNTYNNVWGFTLRGLSDRNLTLWMDRTYGVAAPGNLPAAGILGMAFHQANTKKAYHQLIEPGKPLSLASGLTTGWRGGYIFSNNLSPTADLAQRYYDGNAPKYLTAMVAAGSAKVTTPLADVNKKLIVESAGMTSSAYVPPKGIDLTTAGYNVNKLDVT